MSNRFRGWSRRKKWTVGGLAAVILVAGGAALALFLLRAPLTGGGNVVAAPTATVVDVGVLDSELATCVGGTGNNAQVNDAAAGAGYCEFALSLARTGSGTWVLQDIVFAAAVDEAFLPGECGKAIPATGTANVRFTVNSMTTGPFTAAGDAGVVLVEQSEFNAADCPSL